MPVLRQTAFPQIQRTPSHLGIVQPPAGSNPAVALVHGGLCRSIDPVRVSWPSSAVRCDHFSYNMHIVAVARRV